jgi:hypothetical protein
MYEEGFEYIKNLIVKGVKSRDEFYREENEDLFGD